MNYLKLLLEQFKGLALWQKISIYVTAGVLFTGLIVFGYLYSSGDFVVLYRGLDLDSAAAIKEKIDEGGFAYKLADNGGTIYVSSSQKEIILLKLAKDNVLPDRSKGYADILGSSASTFSNSRKIEDVNIVRSLQGEIETTIKKSSKLISSVRLHIFYAPERTFKEDQKLDKVTVYIVLKSGKKLENDQIIGIRNLVANATGIVEDNVSIIDQDFVDLSKKLRRGKNDETATADQFTLQRNFVEEKEGKLQEMLNRILGYGMAVVTVYADLNFDKKEVYDEIIEPPIKGEEGGMVISEEVTEEKFSGKGKKPVGVPGTQSNIPTYPEVKEGQDEYSHKESRKNYDTTKKKVRTIYAIGDIKKLNISVVIDDLLSKEQQTKIENAMFSAAGIDKKRGDTLVVERFPFNRESVAKQEKLAQKARLEDMIFQLMLVMIPTATIFFILWFVWKNKELLITYFKPIEVPKKEGAAEEGALILPSEVKERNQKVDLIKEFVNRSPKDAATLMQLWLTAE